MRVGFERGLARSHSNFEFPLPIHCQRSASTLPVHDPSSTRAPAPRKATSDMLGQACAGDLRFCVRSLTIVRAAMAHLRP